VTIPPSRERRRAGGDTPEREREQPEELDVGRVLRLVGRALRLRCPSCGRGRVLASYFRLEHHCQLCGLRYERGEGDYWMGAYVLNLVAAELVFALLLVVVLIASWPDVPWDSLEYACAVGVVVAPILLYPLSKLLWLALDVAFRPPGIGDIEQHG
jgi:uncharacterized protein (DUF983 family)